MLYVKPNYYNKFKCIADKCEATCCAGWQIVIDEDSLGQYETEERPYGEILRQRIDWEEGVFKQDRRKHCAFLKEDGFCEMYQELGEESLCMTCTNYPRHIEEFENLREITLAISCPEAARIILEQKEPVTFLEEETDEEDEEFEDFDPFFFSYLEDARAIMLSILQNRTLPVAVRAALVQNMAEEMQDIIENADLFDLADVFEKYEDEEYISNAVSHIEKDLKVFYGDFGEHFRYSKAVFGRLYELEYLSDDWGAYLEQCWDALYGKGPKEYCKLQENFQEWCIQKNNGISMEIILEQLLVYFIFTYFCGAVYDDNVFGKVKMSVDSVNILYEMLVAKWIEGRGALSAKAVQQVVYRYSRELEHSDLNLEAMEG